MATLTKKEMEANLKKITSNAMKLLEDLHVIHKDDPIEKIMDLKLPIGDDMTLATLLVGLYDILEPLIELARAQYPALFMVIDWLEATVEKILTR